MVVMGLVDLATATAGAAMAAPVAVEAGWVATARAEQATAG
jgi:hypothetical protein